MKTLKFAVSVALLSLLVGCATSSRITYSDDGYLRAREYTYSGGSTINSYPYAYHYEYGHPIYNPSNYYYDYHYLLVKKPMCTVRVCCVWKKCLNKMRYVRTCRAR